MISVEWFDKAFCANAEEDFYTESAKKAESLIDRYCMNCPVVQECLSFAIHAEDFEPTIYGGMTGKERKAYVH